MGTLKPTKAIPKRVWLSLYLWLISPILSFKDTGLFFYLNGMPNTDGDLYAIFPFRRTYLCTEKLLELSPWSTGIQVGQLFVEYPVDATFQAHNSLSGLFMPMDGHLSPRFQDIKHTLRSISRRCPQVEILPQPLRFASLRAKSTQKLFIDQLNVHARRVLRI